MMPTAIHATQTAAPNVPTFIDHDERRSRLIFVKCLIEQQASRDTLEAHRDKLLAQHRTRFSAARATLIEALFDGVWELSLDCCRCADEARRRGQLLFAWEGTTVLKGADA